MNENEMKKLLESTVNLKYFDQYLFHNTPPEDFLGHPIGVHYFYKNLNFYQPSFYDNDNVEFNFPEDKINIWYVRNSKCSDYIYGDNEESIKKNIPKEIVDYINNDKLIFILSTGTEFECDNFWERVIDYCKLIGIRKEKIHFITSNYLTKLPNSYSLNFSGHCFGRYDSGISWLDKYPNRFPYNDDYISSLQKNEKSKRFICLNAHYRELRHYIFYKLYKNNLQDLGHYSFTLGQGINYIEHSKERMVDEWNEYSKELDIEDYDFSIDILNKLPINLEQDNFWDTPIVIKNKYLREFQGEYRPWILKDLDMIEDSYFSISTESNNDSDHGKFSYFSEKVMIGWITQPTIIIGTPFTIEHLKNLGFESFGELFDESYDTIISNDERLMKTYNEIERACKMPEKELKAIYNDLLFKVRHNQDTLFKHDFLREFKNILESIKVESKFDR